MPNAAALGATPPTSPNRQPVLPSGRGRLRHLVHRAHLGPRARRRIQRNAAAPGGADGPLVDVAAGLLVYALRTDLPPDLDTTAATMNQRGAARPGPTTHTVRHPPTSERTRLRPREIKPIEHPP